MNTPPARRLGILAILGPGMLVAATGVGAGDLATAALAGSRLGTAVLWAVIVGAVMKFVLTEGLARWQLATDQTLLEGTARHLGRGVLAVFTIYLAAWSFFVGSALVSACGATAHAIWPLPGSTPDADKIVYGIIHSLVALGLVWIGGYRLFERVMGICIGVMFVTVVTTALASGPDLGDCLRGLLVPTIPQLAEDGLGWTVALTGGVGGTVTILCYGYWIREEGRTGGDAMRICRIDLAAGYVMTGVFGLAMVVLATGLETSGSGSRLLVDLADRLQDRLGAAGHFARWAFLIGAWGAIFSSLLGVWQSVPYLFADTWSLWGSREVGQQISTRSWPYRGWLLALATIPLAGLWTRFAEIQKWYAIVGAAFLPAVAVALLVLGRRRSLVGEKLATRWIGLLALVAVLLFYLLAGGLEVHKRLSGT